MPIAFDPPTSAPHGTLPARTTRGQDDDAGAPDLFTQLLMAASVAPEPIKSDAAVAPRKDSAAADAPVTDAPFLMLPLPSVPTLTPPPGQVTIVATQKHATVPPATQAIATPASAQAATIVEVAPVSAKNAPTPAAPARAEGSSHAAPDLPVNEPATDAPKGQHASAPQAAPSLLATLTAHAEIDKATAARPLAERTSATPAPLTAAPQPLPAPPVLHVETVAAPAFTPGWQDETVAKLAHIVVTRNERAELKINPAELGPVSIRVDMNGADHASMIIVAASPETRSALEQSLPQLRDLLASQGITLGQASVQDGSAHRDPSAQGWTGSTQSSADSHAGTGAPHAGETAQRLVRRVDRLVDVFA